MSVETINLFPKIYIQDAEFTSALMFTIWRNNCEMTQALIEVPGIDTRRPTKHGQTVLHFAIDMERGVEMLKVLVNNMSCEVVNQLDGEDMSALDKAVYNGYTKAVQYFATVGHIHWDMEALKCWVQ